MRSRCALLLALASGCLTHLPPPRHSHHDEVAWRPSVAAALEEAGRTGKPLLVVLAAGERDGLC